MSDSEAFAQYGQPEPISVPAPMSTYLYELPTTGAISFAEFCLDDAASYAASISEATQARANLRTALKESKRDHGEKDYLRLIKVRGTSFRIVRSFTFHRLCFRGRAYR